MAKEFGCSESGTRNALRRHKITRKKDDRLPGAGPAKSSGVSGSNQRYTLEKIAYVDESGMDTYLYREYKYVLQGQQAFEVLVFQPASAFSGTRNRDCDG